MYEALYCFEDKNGGGVVCRGLTPVSSPWSNGERETTFAVVVSEHGDVSWEPVGKSRVPHAEDVLAALEGEGILPSASSLRGNVWTEKNMAGVKYRCTRFNGKKHSLGISADGKLSIRGAESIPGEVLRRLLAEMIPSRA